MGGLRTCLPKSRRRHNLRLMAENLKGEVDHDGYIKYQIKKLCAAHTVYGLNYPGARSLEQAAPGPTAAGPAGPRR